MDPVRILAVSLLGGSSLRHITHVWTAAGALPVQHVVDELWRRKSSFYVFTPNGRAEVAPVPARGPNLLQRMLGKPVDGHLASSRTPRHLDALLGLPKLPSPSRGRRSQQRVSTMQAPLDMTITTPLPR